jgi:glutathione S-transferase
MIQLYDFHLSGNAHKVRNMLSLLDIEYERLRVDLLAGKQRRAAFTEMNPFGHVPVLVDDGVVIRDSSAILVYLGRKYGRGRWLPVDALGEARVAEWLATATSEVSEGPGRARLIESFGAPGDPVVARKLAHRVFEVFDRHLENHAFLARRGPTIADVANYTSLALAPEGGIDLHGYSNVRRWFQRLATIPGFEPAPFSSSIPPGPSSPSPVRPPARSDRVLNHERT